jgi:hypothetical protein
MSFAVQCSGMSEYDKELESDSKEVEEAESKLGRGEKRQDAPLKDTGEATHSSYPDVAKSPGGTR